MSIELAPGIDTPLTGIRKTAAKHMVKAWSAPVFHLTVDIDMTHALGVKEVVPSATVTDVIIQAFGRALVDHPEVNVHVGEDSVTTYPDAHVGIAVASPKGLTVPVIHHASTKTLAEIAHTRSDVVARAREGKLTREDITGGTFTVSNLGMMGVCQFDAILNVPQAAIVAIGHTQKQYVLRDDTPVWAPLASFTLTCDHRALDGAAGATFLQTVKAALEKPVTV
jgi:pyruvate dehydrogenase E2 component (dihydrolipoamide acetyltransferase)